jgi:dipeptidyl-peptidase 4
MIRPNLRRAVFFCLLVACLATVTFAQSDPALLTLDRIYNSDEFNGRGVGGFKWLKDGNSYARIEPSAATRGSQDIVRYDIATGNRQVLLAAEKLKPADAEKSLAINGYDWSADDTKMLIYTNSKKVWRQNTRGDYWVLDLASGKLTKLGGDAKPSTMMFAKFSPDGKKVGYVCENDLYVQDVATGKITRLTKDGSHTLINGTSDWVNEEELDLRDCWRWSPDSKSIAFWQFDASGIKDFILLNNTKGVYPELTYIPYPKAGTTNAAVRAGVIGAAGGPTVWMKTPGDPRNNYIAMMDWTDNSSEIVLQYLNRRQNKNEVMYGNAKSGAVRTVLTESDAAWVDVNVTKMTWLEGGKRFLWVSERDGWNHVYSVSRDGKDVKLITPGDFDVINIQSVDEQGGWLYYRASPETATQRYLFRRRLDGSGTAERVTPDAQKGWHNYNISPNSRWAFHNYSSFGAPAKFEVVDLANKSVQRVMEENSALRAKLATLKLGPREFFRVDIGQGVTLDGWMIKPPDFDASKKYPVLMFAYGEPAAQTVMDTWGGDDYLWYQMLAQQGYIIASVDNRGTPAARGRAWRKAIYKKNGVVNSQDQAGAIRSMVATLPFVDGARIGIWGWSGGGSSTLNAMFRYPELYKMGMAVAPEADIRYYDTIYTERYMGLPQDNPEEYKQGSPITYVDGLKGDLLIVHGTGDDNVHYQATEYLINALVAKNKVFTMMAYPNRTHGIFEGDGTTLHLYSLLTRYLKEHLPAGPR